MEKNAIKVKVGNKWEIFEITEFQMFKYMNDCLELPMDGKKPKDPVTEAIINLLKSVDESLANKIQEYSIDYIKFIKVKEVVTLKEVKL